MDKQGKLIAKLFKDTLLILLLSMFVSIIGSITDGAITGNFLGTNSIAAFGMTMPYQKFIGIFPLVMMVGMRVLCSKSLDSGDLREVNGFFSLAVAASLAIMIF